MKKNHVKQVTNLNLSSLSLAVASVFVTLSLNSTAFAQESNKDFNKDQPKAINISSNNGVNNVNVINAKFSNVKEVNKENRAAGKVIQVGEDKNASLPPMKGWANELPLIEVLKQITPNGWVVKKGLAQEPLNTQQLTSWKGGKSWVETLNDVAVDNHLNVIVNWNKKEIAVSQAPKLEKVLEKIEVRSDVNVANANKANMDVQPPRSYTMKDINSKKEGEIFELEKEETIAMGNSKANEFVPQNNVGALPPPRFQRPQTLPAPIQAVQAPVVVNAWTLEPTKSLKENVIDFGKAAGYKVEWIGEDYPIDDARPLNGEFDADNGPIKQLSKDYGPKSRVKQPLSFQFFQNRTLVVENWQFEQQGYPQYTQQ